MVTVVVPLHDADGTPIGTADVIVGDHPGPALVVAHIVYVPRWLDAGTLTGITITPSP